MNTLRALSDALAAAARAVGPSVLTVDAGHPKGSSGLVWSADGLVLTAAHKLQRDEGITVGLGDGAPTRPARVVGVDASTDLALLQVQDAALAPLTWAPLDGLAVGQLTLALARPGRTVRAALGVVSTLSDGEWRAPGGARLARYIETDIGGRPGFSGGVLVDAEGRAIGLNTGGLARGVSLTIPAATLERVVHELREHGRVRRGYVGVALYPVALPRRLAEARGQEAGLVVVGLEAEGPADTAGLLLGDVILTVAGHATSDVRELQGALDAGTIGAEVEVVFVRGGEVHTRAVRVGSRA